MLGNEIDDRALQRKKQATIIKNKLKVAVLQRFGVSPLSCILFQAIWIDGVLVGNYRNTINILTVKQNCLEKVEG